MHRIIFIYITGNKRGETSRKKEGNVIFSPTNVKLEKQGHPTDCFGRISVRKTSNRLKFSVWEMSSRAFLIKINQCLLFSERQKLRFWHKKRSATIFGKEI